MFSSFQILRFFYFSVAFETVGKPPPWNTRISSGSLLYTLRVFLLVPSPSVVPRPFLHRKCRHLFLISLWPSHLPLGDSQLQRPYCSLLLNFSPTFLPPEHATSLNSVYPKLNSLTSPKISAISKMNNSVNSNVFLLAIQIQAQIFFITSFFLPSYIHLIYRSHRMLFYNLTSTPSFFITHSVMQVYAFATSHWPR